MSDFQHELSNLLPEIMASPRLFPLSLDPERAAALIIDGNPDFYRNAIFLDERALQPGARGAWVPLDTLWRHMDASDRGYLAPANFIFHTGHCGSTLISRLLDEVPSVLGLREPLVLRTLAAGLHGRGFHGGSAFEDLFKRIYLLLGRRYSPTQKVIIKPTSMCNNLAAVLLAQNPANRAILLFVTLEVYLANTLDKDGTADIDGFLDHRVASLQKVVPDLDLQPRNLTLPEKTAFSWLTEAAQFHLLSTRGLAPRLSLIDFDRFLDQRAAGLSGILHHFSIPDAAAEVERLLASRLFGFYSKQTGFAYSQDDRMAMLNESRSANRAEIQSGLQFVERMMKTHPDLGEIAEKIPLG